MIAVEPDLREDFFCESRSLGKGCTCEELIGLVAVCVTPLRAGEAALSWVNLDGIVRVAAHVAL